MRYLVDTNAWIGFLQGRSGFSRAARETMATEPVQCRISVASIWEASIKVALGKLKLPYDLDHQLPRILERNNFELLTIEFEDAIGVGALEHHHGDPFDRLQVIQARRRNLSIVSADPVFEQYQLRRIW